MVQELPNLKQVSLAKTWYMGMDDVDDQLCALTQVEDLDFGICNTIECKGPRVHMLHEDWAGMTQLTRLKLSNNICDIRGVSRLTNLVTLDLTDSQPDRVCETCQHAWTAMELAASHIL